MSDLLFGGPDETGVARRGVTRESARVLITVKASPNPSGTHGETVCVAGIRLDDNPGWIRLYPINFRELEGAMAFRKYDVVDIQIDAQPRDSRVESARPEATSFEVVKSLKTWDLRRAYVEPFIGQTACRLFSEARQNPRSQSLALIRPAEVLDLVVETHPGWTPQQQSVIDGYANQMQLFGRDRVRLQPPRFVGKYRYRCEEPDCRTHEQAIIDWEFSAFQFNQLDGFDDGTAIDHLRAKFLDQLCAPNRDTAFYLGNQAKRRHAFSILGVWWPPTR